MLPMKVSNKYNNNNKLKKNLIDAFYTGIDTLNVHGQNRQVNMYGI